MRLKDKAAIITGGGGDIAKATAEKFLKNGASVLLFDYDEELLGKTMKELTQYIKNVKTVVGDTRKLDDMNKAVEMCVKEFGKVDILVTCAGIAKHMPIDEMPEEVWQKVIDINLTGTFIACKAVVPIMKMNKYGRIVNISSLGGRTGRPYVGVNYAASKSGVIGLTMCLAYELGPSGITVNAVAPGPLDGRMTKTFPPEKVEMLKVGLRIERLGSPDDIASAVLYLASDEASWVTGEVLDVNGGLYI
ncbi:3-oxoacyl-ACP reductase FabG [Thermoanaerobacteraceae bacterium SP2]|nr:3-oxoacyl-ACP reductase FabG [Thermoanaerobacteraceae bacterium SP2]